MSKSILRSLAVVSWLGAALAVADESLLAPRDGVVLLANGELISGKIISAGDRLDIHLPHGEICLRRADVRLICNSAAECYRHKRADIDPGRVQDHLDLAEWCLRNGLLDEAERELTDARRADASHPKLRVVASRLELAREPIPSQATATSTQTVTHVPLASVARNLPPGTMETFTNSIQPLLINYCSKSGCHASRSDGGMKLERVHPRMSGRSTTQRNLEQVLALIDRENPSASRLLQAPIRPHGTVKSPIFTDRQHGQYRQLVQWTYAVAGARMPFERPSLEERTAPLLQSLPGAVGGSSALAPLANDPIRVDELPLGTLDDELPEVEARPDALPAASSAEQAYTPEQLKAMGIDPNAPGPNFQSGGNRVQRGAKLPQAFTPRDEFDPEIFNRRYFSSASP